MLNHCHIKLDKMFINIISILHRPELYQEEVYLNLSNDQHLKGLYMYLRRFRDVNRQVDKIRVKGGGGYTKHGRKLEEL